MPHFEQDHAADVAAESARLAAASEALAQRSPEARADALCSAAELLQQQVYAPESGLVEALHAQAGLSRPMVQWACRTSLASFEPGTLRWLATEHAQAPVESRQRPGLCAVVLSGNVCTAALRALSLPLLAGRAVLAKAATGQDAMARALHNALQTVDPVLGDALGIVRFGRHAQHLAEATGALVEHAAVVSAYGDQAALDAIAAQLPEHTRLLAHGPGLSAVYLTQSSLSEGPSRGDLLRRIALDVAAYDQRGCLSPHHVFVERGTRPAEAVAHELSNALATLGVTLPRGRADEQTRAQCMQWRGVAAASGQLIEGTSHAVSIEPRARSGPGHRHVALVVVDGRRDLIPTLQSWGPHLKSLCAPDLRTRLELQAALAPHQVPELAAPGSLQTPPFDALADGLRPLAGL